MVPERELKLPHHFLSRVKQLYSYLRSQVSANHLEYHGELSDGGVIEKSSQDGSLATSVIRGGYSDCGDRQRRDIFQPRRHLGSKDGTKSELCSDRVLVRVNMHELGKALVKKPFRSHKSRKRNHAPQIAGGNAVVNSLDFRILHSMYFRILYPLYQIGYFHIQRCGQGVSVLVEAFQKVQQHKLTAPF